MLGLFLEGLFLQCTDVHYYKQPDYEKLWEPKHIPAFGYLPKNLNKLN